MPETSEPYTGDLIINSAKLSKQKLCTNETNKHTAINPWLKLEKHIWETLNQVHHFFQGDLS